MYDKLLLVHCAEQIGTYVEETAASAFLALVTFARMSLTPAVQMKGFGSVNVSQPRCFDVAG